MNLPEHSARIHTAIDAWIVQAFPSELRAHLGGSLIGRKCARELWYGFRWVALPDYRTRDADGEVHDEAPRMQRLFRRGHSEEDRLLNYLRGIGIEISERDETQPRNADGEFPQHRITGVGGHFGGSLDAIATLPAWLLGTPATAVVELKTYGKKAWAKLKQFGLGNLILDRYGKPYRDESRVKPEHCTQMNTYGVAKGISLALYLAIEKDTDDLHVELREINALDGANSFVKAEHIIRSQRPPPRISELPTAHACRYCDFRLQCHEGAPPSQVNCRSCKWAEPMPGPTWVCNARAAAVIPDHIIPQACELYHPITHT